MSDVQAVILAHPWGGHRVNETIHVDAQTARNLVQAGAARYTALQEPVRLAEEHVPAEDATPVPPPPTASVRGDKAVPAVTATVTPKP